MIGFINSIFIFFIISYTCIHITFILENVHKENMLIHFTLPLAAALAIELTFSLILFGTETNNANKQIIKKTNNKQYGFFSFSFAV